MSSKCWWAFLCGVWPFALLSRFVTPLRRWCVVALTVPYPHAHPLTNATAANTTTATTPAATAKKVEGAAAHEGEGGVDMAQLLLSAATTQPLASSSHPPSMATGAGSNVDGGHGCVFVCGIIGPSESLIDVFACTSPSFLLPRISSHYPPNQRDPPHCTSIRLSLVPILQGQRDRYKQRVRELEREVEAAGAAAAREKAVSTRLTGWLGLVRLLVGCARGVGWGRGGGGGGAGESGGCVRGWLWAVVGRSYLCVYAGVGVSTDRREKDRLTDRPHSHTLPLPYPPPSPVRLLAGRGGRPPGQRGAVREDPLSPGLRVGYEGVFS